MLLKHPRKQGMLYYANLITRQQQISRPKGFIRTPDNMMHPQVRAARAALGDRVPTEDEVNRFLSWATGEGTGGGDGSASGAGVDLAGRRDGAGGGA